MELRQLRYFCMLAAELSFTQAAAKLHVSQPPLSFQIAQLEKELGVRLFERTSRSVQLNDAGRAFLPHAQAVLAQLEQGREHVQRVAAGLEGRVVVGLAGSHFLGPFPQFIAQFRATSPHVELVLQEMQPSQQLQTLRAGRLDLCIGRTPVDDGQLSSALLWHDPVMVAMPATHRLAGSASLLLSELRHEEFIFLKLESSQFAQRLLDACVQSGFAPRITQSVVEVPAALNLVAAGLGVALVPASLACLRTQAVHMCPVRPARDEPLVDGDVHMVWRSAEGNRAVAQFRLLLQTWAIGQLGQRPAPKTPQTP